MAIQLFEPKFHVEECLQEIKECLERGWTGVGYKTVIFEEEWKNYTGLPHALFLNSCTAALNLAVEILMEFCEWSADDEIITTPNTFVSTNHAILRSGLKPIFADIDQTMCMDPNDVERKITDRTRALIYVGVGGNSGHYDKIIALCEKYNLKLILDAAHMAGTRYKGEPIGKEADVVCYSFHAVKNLPTADSGMVCFKELDMDKVARKKAWLGINKNTFERNNEAGGYQWQYDVEYVGYKYHGNSIMAAIALAQIPYLDEDNKRRREISDLYRRKFEPYRKWISMVKIPEECNSSCHLFQILVNNRDKMVDDLRANDIFPGVHYINNTHYDMYKDQKESCPFAEYASEHLLSLPIHLKLTDEQVIYIAEKVIGFIKRQEEII